MNIRKGRLGSTLLLLVFISSCASTESLVSSPTVSLTSVHLDKASLSGQTFQLGFDVDNPNPFPLPVQTVEYRVLIEDQNFARGSTDGGFIVPAGGEDEFVISVELDILNTTPQLSSLFRGDMTDGINYELQGSLTVDIPFAKPLPFSSTGVIQMQGNLF